MSKTETQGQKQPSMNLNWRLREIVKFGVLGEICVTGGGRRRIDFLAEFVLLWAVNCRDYACNFSTWKKV
jgi:hypothetical protein